MDKVIEMMKAQGVEYHLAEVLDIYWLDITTEIFWRSFRPIKNFDRQTEAVYVYRGARSEPNKRNGHATYRRRETASGLVPLIYLSNQLAEVSGHFRRKRHRFAAEGVIEGDRTGIKRQMRVWSVAFAVFFVAHDRVADAGNMNRIWFLRPVSRSIPAAHDPSWRSTL